MKKGNKTMGVIISKLFLGIVIVILITAGIIVCLSAVALIIWTFKKLFLSNK